MIIIILLLCDDQQQYKAILRASIVSIPEGSGNIPMSPGPLVTVKTLVQENHSVNLLFCWMSKRKTSCWVGDEKSKRRQSNQSVCCGPVYQIGTGIHKNEQVKNLYRIGFYNIPRFCNIQLAMVALKYLLVVPLNHIGIKKYLKYLSESFTIAWLVP